MDGDRCRRTPVRCGDGEDRVVVQWSVEPAPPAVRTDAPVRGRDRCAFGIDEVAEEEPSDTSSMISARALAQAIRGIATIEAEWVFNA